jgi:CheY-like chemotaxis protein
MNFLSDKTILIVEDDESSFSLLKELLFKHNMQIIRAISGYEAVEICKENVSIDLVLMDIKLPELSGYEATRQIKSFRPGLPIIAQSAYGSDQEKQQAIDCGCSDFLDKPIQINQLFSKIQEQL